MRVGENPQSELRPPGSRAGALRFSRLLMEQSAVRAILPQAPAAPADLNDTAPEAAEVLRHPAEPHHQSRMENEK
jgi:hypothetical protein